MLALYENEFDLNNLFSNFSLSYYFSLIGEAGIIQVWLEIIQKWVIFGIIRRQWEKSAKKSNHSVAY